MEELINDIVLSIKNSDFSCIDKCSELTFIETKDIVFSALNKVENISFKQLRNLFDSIDSVNSGVSDYLDKNFVISCLVFEFWHTSFATYFSQIECDQFFDDIFEADKLNEEEFTSLYLTLLKNDIQLDNTSIETFLCGMKYDDDTYHTLFDCLHKLYNEKSSVSHIIPGETLREDNLTSLKEIRELDLSNLTDWNQVSDSLNDLFNDEEINVFATVFSVLPLHEKYRIISNVDEEHSNEVNCKDEYVRFSEIESLLFKYYGPLNTSKNPLHDNCKLYGGCRMLLCNEYATFNEDDDIEVFEDDWFTGYCEVCNAKIKKRCHSIRFAREQGGWSGCYCSTNCVKNLEMSKIEKKINSVIEEQLDDQVIFDSK